MKNRIILFTLLLAILTIFSSCEDLLSTASDEVTDATISERIDLFEDDLNSGNYDNVYLNFHPDMISYESYKDGSTINVGILDDDYYPFTFGTPSPDSGSGNVDVTGTFSNSVYSGTYSATMKEDGSDNWKILSLTILTTTYEGLSF